MRPTAPHTWLHTFGASQAVTLKFENVDSFRASRLPSVRGVTVRVLQAIQAIGILAPSMENRMEKNMEHGMETVVLQGLVSKA